MKNKQSANQPLVSVLIPTYNQTFFLEKALNSALNQTYKNLEIIVCDDSTTNEVEEFMENYTKKYHHIKYIKNEFPLGRFGANNAKKLFDLANGEYISYLFHDDLYYNTRIEKMMNYFIYNKDISIITSSRNLIDENDKIIDKLTITNGEDLKLDGANGIRTILFNVNNFIGEPTTAIFRKSALKGNVDEFNGKDINALLDINIWVKVLSQGNLIFIDEPLSAFRQHGEQNTQNNLIKFGMPIDFYYFIEGFKDNKKVVQNEKEYKLLLETWEKGYGGIIKTINLYQPLEKDITVFNNLKEKMNTIKENNQKILKYSYKCNLCNNYFDSFGSLPRHFESESHIEQVQFENYNIETYFCPHCLSADRDRMYKEYLDRNFIDISSANILHVAPEKTLRAYFTSLNNPNYICGDLYPTDDGILKMDITNIQYEDNYFDLIICSHVLEHVIEDTKAMKELYRVLKPSAMSVLQVPIAMNLDNTFEKNDIAMDLSEYDKLRYFGQNDHIRLYGNDYSERLKSVGFNVDIYNCHSNFGVEKATQLGLSQTDTIYIGKK